MRRYLYSILSAIVAVAGMSSCAEEISPKNGNAGGLSVHATTEYVTKAALSGNDETGYAVLWQTNDEISIDGKAFRLQSGEGTKEGTFQLISGTAPADGNHYAYYPSSYDGNGWIYEQTYVAGNITGSPMKAQAVVSNGGMSISDLHFTNEGGILRLTVTGASDIKVKTITVSAEELSNPITLTCGTPVALNTETGVQFHISMPENQTGYSDFCVSFKDNEGTIIDTKTLKQGTLVIKRSIITNASFELHRTATLKVATFNVDGLPVFLPLGDGLLGKFVKSLSISGIRIDDDYNLYINEDGPGTEGSKAISAKVADKGWDVFGMNEDFNYHTEVWSELGKYSMGTYQGGFFPDNYWSLIGKFIVQSPLFNIDGLEFGVKSSRCSMSGENMQPWNSGAVYGYLSNDNDGLTKKGFRYYTVNVDKDGINQNVDFIILHADAGDDKEDITAREAAYAQLIKFITGIKTGNPMIMMGDWNTRYYRDKFKELFIDKLNAIDGIEVRDAWVEYNNAGNYPQYGGPSDSGQTDHGKTEELDKILFLNREASPVELKLVSANNVTDFVYNDGRQLSDHLPTEATFKLICKTAKD